MKTIVVKYHGATESRGSRLSATDESGNRVVIPYPHEAHDAPEAAARALCEKIGWKGKMISGSGVKGRFTRVFVGPIIEAAIVEVK